ncbi:hypothetical protein [Pannonibacter sp.]|uniref:hypothetical protein n=1 Tax=Pannonibacter sp. TaxID=1906786 RepID=UPI003F719AE3
MRQRVIEAAMYAFLGFLAAGLLALLILPAVWRRAVRLTRDAVLATHPSTYREVKAAQDALRAEAALTHRRLERELDRLKAQAAKARAEAGKYLPERLALQTQRNELSEHRREVDALLAAQTDENRQLREDLTLARTEANELAASLKQAETEVADLLQLLDSRRGTSSDPLAAATISALEAQIASLQRQLASRTPTATQMPAPPVEALADQIQPDADMVRLRRSIARLESELMDRETDFIAAQADVARLTLQLDLAGGLPDGLVAQMDQTLKETARENAKLAARAAAQDRALAKTRAEIARLTSELATSPAVTALRDELKALAGSVIAARTEQPEDEKPKTTRSRKAAGKAATLTEATPAPTTPATAARLSAVEIAGRIVRASTAAREALSVSTAPQTDQPGANAKPQRAAKAADQAGPDKSGQANQEQAPREGRSGKKQIVA